MQPQKYCNSINNLLSYLFNMPTSSLFPQTSDLNTSIVISPRVIGMDVRSLFSNSYLGWNGPAAVCAAFHGFIHTNCCSTYKN